MSIKTPPVLHACWCELGQWSIVMVKQEQKGQQLLSPDLEQSQELASPAVAPPPFQLQATAPNPANSSDFEDSSEEDKDDSDYVDEDYKNEIANLDIDMIDNSIGVLFR